MTESETEKPAIAYMILARAKQRLVLSYDASFLKTENGR